MRTPLTGKIEEAAASHKDNREAIQEPYLEVDKENPEKGTLIATNGRILAAVPVICDEGDISGVVTARTLADSRKGANVIAAKEELEVPGISKYVRPDVNFPNWTQVVPKKPLESDSLELNIDVVLLLKLAKALGIGNTKKRAVTLRWDKTLEGSAVQMESFNGNGGMPEGSIGVITPLRKIDKK